jgi:hypothetical protein
MNTDLISVRRFYLTSSALGPPNLHCDYWELYHWVLSSVRNRIHVQFGTQLCDYLRSARHTYLTIRSSTFRQLFTNDCRGELLNAKKVVIFVQYLKIIVVTAFPLVGRVCYSGMLCDVYSFVFEFINYPPAVDTIIIVWMFCPKRDSPLERALLCSIKSGLSRINVYSVPLTKNVQAWRKGVVTWQFIRILGICP